MKVVRRYSLEALEELLRDEETRSVGNVPPPLRSIRFEVDVPPAIHSITVVFSDDEDDDEGHR